MTRRIWLYEADDQIGQPAAGWIDLDSLPEAQQEVGEFEGVAGGYIDAAGDFVECWTFAIRAPEELDPEDPEELGSEPPPDDAEFRVVPYTDDDGEEDLAVVRKDGRAILHSYVLMKCLACGSLHDLRTAMKGKPGRIRVLPRFAPWAHKAHQLALKCDCGKSGEHEVSIMTVGRKQERQRTRSRRTRGSAP